MQENIVYSGDEVTIDMPKDRDAVVYPHPSDTLKFNFDLTQLKKEIVNGDLVISLVNGKKITVANYALMIASEDTPSVIDVIGQTYLPDDLIAATSPTLIDDNLSAFILDRKQSSADINIEGQPHLAHAKQSESDEANLKKLSGTIDVEEQSPVASLETEDLPYKILSLGRPLTMKNDIEFIWSFTGRTIKNEDDVGTQPTPVLRARLNVDALYGASYTIDTVSTQSKELSLTFRNGGGIKPSALGYEDIGGLPSVEYQYLRERFDFSGQAKSVQYNGSQSTSIYRQISITARASDVAIQNVRLEGVPVGVEILSTEAYSARPAGQGVYIIESKNQNATINIEMKYDASLEATTAQIGMFVQSFNFKFQMLVVSEDNMVWDFKKVNTIDDIENYNGVNTFTFSTAIDKLEITTGNFNDYILGGIGDHNFLALDGDDIFIAGLGNENINFGNGDDTHHIGLGQDVGDGGEGAFDLIRVFAVKNNDNNVVPNNVTITIGDGNVNINFAPHSTNVRNFEYLELNDAANTVLINNTNNLPNSFNIIGNGIGINQGALDTLNLGVSADIYVAESRLTTNGGAGSINYDVGDLFGAYIKAVGFIQGGAGNDNVFADTNRTISFDGGAGFDTAWYNNVATSGIIYNQAGNGLVTNKGNGQDFYSSIEKIVGSAGADTFYGGFGATAGAMEYWGFNVIDASPNTVTYDSSVSGVTIDYTLNNPYISVFRNNRTIEDKLFYISNILASQQDDTFIMDGTVSRTLDGKQGRDSINYNAISISLITFNINSITPLTGGFSGTVLKGATDNFTSIERFVGGTSVLGNVFNIGIATYFGGAEYVGSTPSNQDIISYAGATDTAIDLNISTGQTIILSATGARRGEDRLSSIENFVLTNNNDVARVARPTDISNLSLLNAGNNSTFTFGDINSRGDVFSLFSAPALNATIDIMLILNNRVINFESLELSNNNNVLFFNAAIPILFQHIYGGTATDTFDISLYAGSMTFEVNGNRILATRDTGEVLYLFSFETLIGSIGADNFNVMANTTNYRFQGGSGTNILNYSGITTSHSTINLEFDLVNQRVIKGGSSTSVDTFTDIQGFVGGDGNDKFILDPNRSFQINGGAGIDTVSFQNYTLAVSNLDITQFTNVEIFELTRFNDTISAFYDARTQPIFIAGGDGTDTYIVSEITAGLTYDVGFNDPSGVIVRATRNNGAIQDRLRSFEVLRGGGFNDVFNVLVSNNIAGGLASNGRMYFLDDTQTDADLVNYSTLTTAVTVTVGGTDGTNSTQYVRVAKTPLSLDLLSNIETINLTGEDDTIFLNLFFPGSSAVTIDAGAGEDTIDLSASFGTYIATISSTTFRVNGTTYNIRAWENLVGGFNDDVFTFVDLLQNYNIDGREGSDRIEADQVTGNVTLNFTGTGVNRIASLTIGTNNIFSNNVEQFVFNGTQRIVINGVLSGTYAFDSRGAHTNNNSMLDYSAVTGNLYGFVFAINDLNRAQIIKDPITRDIDQVLNDFVDSYIATARNDAFDVTVNSTVLRPIALDGRAGKDTLTLRLGGGGAAGIIYDLTTASGRVTTLTNNLILNIAGIEVLNGTTGTDTFRISDLYLSLFNDAGSISGGAGVDTFDASTMTRGIYFDLINSFMYLTNASNQPIIGSVLTISDLEVIRFGSGDDILVVANIPTTTITSIDGGTGTNFLSLENATTSNNVVLGSLGSGGTGSITVTNFNNYRMTRFDDTVRTPNGANPTTSYSVDGAEGTDIMDYSGTTDAGVTLTFVANRAFVEAVRGPATDQLYNFEIFKLSQQSSTVNMGILGVNYTLEGNSAVTNTLNYSTLAGAVTIDLGRDGSVTNRVLGYKFNNTGQLVAVDSALFFSSFVGTAGTDNIILNKDFFATTVTVNLGQAGTLEDSIFATTATANITYTETAAGITIVIGTKTFQITGGANLNIAQFAGSRSNQNVFTSRHTMGVNYEGSIGVGVIDELRYDASVTANLTFDLSAGRVVSNVTTDSFKDIDSFFGSAGNDEFINLNDYTVYRVDGGGGVNTVSYDRSVGAITIAINNAGTVVVNKGSGLVDNLANIRSYRGTNLSDTFTIDITAAGLDTYFFDGASGRDTVVFTGVTGGLTIDYFPLGTSTVNGIFVNMTNFEIINLTANNDSLTLNEAGLTGILDLDGGAHTASTTGDVFALSAASVSIGTLNVQYGSTMNAVLQTANYSVNLTRFETFNFVGSTSASFYNVDFNLSAAANFTFTGLKDVTFFTYTNLNDLDLGSNRIIVNTAGTAPIFTNINVFNFFGASDATPITTNVRVRAGNTVNYNVSFSAGSDLNIIVTEAGTNGTFANISSEGGRAVFATLFTAAAIKVSSADFNNSTLNLSAASNNTVFSVGTSTNNTTLNLFKSIIGNSTTAATVDLQFYGGTMGTMTFTNTNVTANFNGAQRDTVFTAMNRFTLTANNDNIILRDFNGNISGGGVTDSDNVRWERGVTSAVNAQTSALTINSAGVASGGSTGITLTNFESIDFSNLDADAARASKGVRIAIGGSNLWSRITAPSSNETAAGPGGTTHNVLDFSTVATLASTALTVSFVTASATTVASRLFNVTGVYAVGANNYTINGFNNFKHVVGSAGNDTIKFAPLTLEQFRDLGDKLFGTGGVGVGTNRRNESLYFNGGGGTDLIDLSSWNIYLDYDVSLPPASNAAGLSNIIMAYDSASVWAVGKNNAYPSISNYKPFIYVDSTIENFVLPRGIVYIESTIASSYTITAPRTGDKYSYVIFSGSTHRTTATLDFYQTTKTLFVGTEGVSTFTVRADGARHEFRGVEAFTFTPAFADDLNIGGSGDNGVFISSKARINMDSYFTGGGFSATGDNVNFFRIDTGSYYFTYETWDNPRDNYKGLGAPSNTNRSVNSTYTGKYTAIPAGGTWNQTMGAGIGFTSYAERFLIEGGDRTNTMQLFYGIQGVDSLSLTSTADIFSMGKFYYSDVNYRWVSPYLVSIAATRTQSLLSSATANVNGGTGTDTYLDQAVTADFYRAANTRQEMHVVWDITIPVDGITEIKVNTTNTTAPSGLLSLIGGGTTNPGVRLEDEYKKIYIKNFETLDVKDYGTDLISTANYVVMQRSTPVTGTRAYRGKDDDANIVHRNVAGAPPVIQVDLGGRYMADSNTNGYDRNGGIWNFGDAVVTNGYHTQNADISYASIPTAIQLTVDWLFDASPLVDSAVSIRTTGAGPTSYIIKNFDTLDINDVVVGSSLNFNFRNNFNFNVLDGKMFKFGLATPNDRYNFFTGYNYTVTQETGDPTYVRVNETAGTRYFRLWLEGITAGSIVPATRTADDTGNIHNYNYTAAESNNSWVYGNQSNEAPKAANSEVVFESFKNSKITEPSTLNALNNDANSNVSSSFKDDASKNLTKSVKEEETNLNANKKPNNDEEASYNKETIKTTEEAENPKEAKLDSSEESVLEALNIEALNKTIEEANTEEATSYGSATDVNNAADFNILNLAFSSNEGLDETQEVQVQGIKDMANINEDSIINTNNIDEASSMSFALEDSMSVSDDNSNLVLIDANKNKNNNGFGGI